MAEQKATTRPSRPTIDTVTDNVPPHTGMIENGGLTNDPRPTVSGRGDPGSTIHLLVDGVEVGTVVVGANGTWSFAPTQPLHDGQYRLTARASNEVGMSIPSTSYSIQVDVTPPSQPKIESATEGAQPTLSGQAEAYSTVAIYDGTTLLGTTKTGVDGTWTFQVTSPLSNGTHALTVTATDPAGNTSARSDGFDVTVGPVTPPVPLAKAVLDDMGHDSGNFNFDRLTNDGKGGRLLTGHLMGALAANEKVQVSTDGGRTWFDAVMKSDGTWMVTDLNEHGGNWTIQTRVVNGDGVTGPVMAYDVELDTTSPDHVLSAVRSGNVIDVSFASKDMTVGDAINVMIGDHRVSYNLTAADIAAGRVKVTIPAGIAATMDEHTSYGVALVDRAGNISDYLVTKFVEKNSEGNGGSGISYKITDFNNEAPREIAGGIPVNFGVFTAVLSYKPTVNGKPIDQGVRVKGGSGADANEVGLVFSFKEPPRFHLNNGAHAKAVSFDLDNRSGYTLMVRFYDDAGKLIFKQFLDNSDLNNPSGGGLHSYQIVLPDSLQFSSFTLGWFEKNEGALPATATAWIDNIGFSGGSFTTATWETVTELVPPADVQHVLASADAEYFGSANGTEFQLDNVSYFTNGHAGLHGGAGIDTLKLMGAGQTLDISKLLNVGGHDKITSIEIIDITGTGNNTLKLSMRDVLELGHENVFRNDGHTQLMVNGNAGDRVELSGMSGLAQDGGWANKGLVAINGQAYTLYENAAMHVELLVQSAVSTQLT
ncbi:Ig-like domain-containing protein [Burkholderia contaminans]|uniref:Ig-like domain-containing protein n=1 Tax=Burkholderia contaminans TaxID=488447 RepID=UPI001589D5FD|nr:Ig-like domain-containing protein [Burkholderia contaminans]